MIKDSPLIYPNDPDFWEFFNGNFSAATQTRLPSTNTLVVFSDPLTGRIKLGTEEDIPSYAEADLSDDDYQQWFYA